MDTKTELTRPALIREDIDETREALTEKLENLEDRLREGVETAKHTVEEKLENVRSSVRKISPLYQAKQRPLVAVGATAAAGFVIGRWLNGRKRVRLGSLYALQPRIEPLAELPRTTEYEAWEAGARPLKMRYERTGPTLWSRFSERFGEEIQLVKGLALLRAIDAARDFAKRSAPSFAAEIDKVLDSARGKVEPASASQARSTRDRNAHESRPHASST